MSTTTLSSGRAASDVPSVEDLWHSRLSGAGRRRVVLPEGSDPRVVAAAARLAADGLVEPLLIRDSHTGRPGSSEIEVTDSGATSIDAADLAAGATGDQIGSVAAERGWTDEQLAARRTDPLYLATAMVRAGEADACVAGAARPSGDVIRAGLHLLGLRPGSTLLSSSFLLVMPDARTLMFGDCAVVPQPDVDQLAQIAVATADTYARLTGRDPQVAMLSFSTMGSAEHPAAQQVRQATELVRRLAPGLAVDGELQFDAAVVESVAAQKAGDSRVAGHANVLVFPDLASGNIGYKIAQRLGGAQAYGPILQGLAAPLNDLSRGCSVEDVISVATISAVQSLELHDADTTHGDDVGTAG